MSPTRNHTRLGWACALALCGAAITAQAATLTVTDDLLLHLAADSGVTTSGSTVTNWADQGAVGGANDATAPGAGPTYVASGIGGLPTLSFDAGSSQYLQIGANAAFDSDEMTWFIVAESDTPGSTTQLIRSSYTSGAGGGSVALWGTFTQSNLYKSHARSSAGSFRSSDVAATTDPSLITASWTAGDSITATVNGTSGPTTSDVTATPTGHNFTRIGANSAAVNEFFDGNISEILVYNTTLSDSQVNNVQGYLNVKYGFVDRAALADGLVLYSPMDDDTVNRSGTYPPPALSTDGGNWTVQDVIGTPQNGTATSDNTTGRVNSSAPGVVGEAIDFSADKGGNRRVDYGDVLDITPSTSQTISLWMNSREFNQTVFIAGKGNRGSGDNGWGIALLAEGGGRLLTRAEYTGSDNATQNLGVVREFDADDVNAWHHVVVVIDNVSGEFTAYYDGLSSGATGTDNGWTFGGGGDTNTFAPGRDFSTASPILLGIRDDLAAEWDGMLDEFYIWNRALSAQEVADLYNLGLAGQSVIPAPAALPAGLALMTAIGLRRRRSALRSDASRSTSR